MNHFVLKAMTPRVPAPGVEMRVINGEKMTMVFFKLEPGAGVPLHAHPHEQVGTVLKGSIEFVSNLEIRNSKQIQNTNAPMFKTETQ